MASKLLILTVTLSVVAMVIISTTAAPAQQFNKKGNSTDGDNKIVLPPEGA